MAMKKLLIETRADLKRQRAYWKRLRHTAEGERIYGKLTRDWVKVNELLKDWEDSDGGSEHGQGRA